MPEKKTPLLHVARHWPPMQAPAPHETPHAPQLAGSRWRSTQAALQVSMHTVPQVPLVHVARSNAFPAGQVVQPAPHAAATPSPTQLPVAPPQRVFPAAQVVLHEVPSHVGTEPGTPSAQRVHVAGATQVARHARRL
jgi:hypothetical protein